MMDRFKQLEYTFEEALMLADKYGLKSEVFYEMDVNGLSPTEALFECDIL